MFIKAFCIVRFHHWKTGVIRETQNFVIPYSTQKGLFKSTPECFLTFYFRKREGKRKIRSKKKNIFAWRGGKGKDPTLAANLPVSLPLCSIPFYLEPV
ncbi:hypothetical protein TNCT_305151 [Trichonephila clavata]|uniref:Uncharacterized protein n=1 Tax=Trichonephila clavata TaxID=2740835 RepID=A0A8X6IMH7_TRICU|nr:hypothetical protein TNCT_305151 [Trichonephila clavata]